MEKILLINPPFEKVYEGTKMAKMAPSTPPLSLAVLGASLLEKGHAVKVFDFNLPGNNIADLRNLIKSFNPEFIGITFVTPLFKEMQKIVEAVKEIDNEICVIGGGTHCSSYPKETLEESQLDIAVIGEGDFVIGDIVGRSNLREIKGIAYRDDHKIIVNERAKPIENLDGLAYPAYELYEFRKYRIPKTLAKKHPVAWMETSRGCVYDCVYCNKSIFGRRFRTKSPERVLNEMLRLKEMGIQEVHFTDDAFTTDIKRAKIICDLLTKEKVNLPFALITGIRVDQVDYELLKKLKGAGCYKVFFGIESGDQNVLGNIKKGITLNQAKEAVTLAKKAGLETWGAFMIGLPGETEGSMRNTIKFVRSLPFDLVKMSIMIPLPATPIFEEWSKKGIIKTRKWEKFSFYNTPTEIYDHPNLSWEQIMRHYNRFYKEFYFRPVFILKQLKNGIRNGMLWEYIKIFLGTRWFR